VAEISVVIPTFNTAEMTLRCCRSVPDAAEVIVADDGSTDGTAELVAPFARVVRLDVNRGFAAAANAGVAAAIGRIILLLNSDAVAQPGALDAMVAAFDADPKLGVAGARLLNEDGSPQWSGGATPTLAWMIGVVSGAGHLARSFRRSRGERRDVDWVSGAAMAFRREVWHPLNDRYLFYCQDIDFCLAARDAGWKVRIVEDARVVHALGATIAVTQWGAGAPAGEGAGAPLSYDPARLWPDLLTWGRARYGRAWTMFARPILTAVAALRILFRWRDAAVRRGFRAIRRSE